MIFLPIPTIFRVPGYSRKTKSSTRVFELRVVRNHYSSDCLMYVYTPRHLPTLGVNLGPSLNASSVRVLEKYDYDTRGRTFSQAGNELGASLFPARNKLSMLFPYTSFPAGNELILKLTKNTASGLNLMKL